jgi:hypothetical protein
MSVQWGGSNRGAHGMIDISAFTSMNGIVCGAVCPRVSAGVGLAGGRPRARAPAKLRGSRLDVY